MLAVGMTLISALKQGLAAPRRWCERHRTPPTWNRRPPPKFFCRPAQYFEAKPSEIVQIALLPKILPQILVKAWTKPRTKARNVGVGEKPSVVGCFLICKRQ